MSARVLVEVATDNVEDALVALANGADRVELCAGMDVDGLTPGFAEVRRLVMAAPGRVVVMVRERPGAFTASGAELDAMERRIAEVRDAGAAGAVFGVLEAWDGGWRVDGRACERLVRACGGMPAVFHRAIDVCADAEGAMEAVVRAGFRRVLMSGGANVSAIGAMERLKACVLRAAGRVEVMAGGGVRAVNAAVVAGSTGCVQVHSSCRGADLRFSVEELRAIVAAVR